MKLSFLQRIINTKLRTRMQLIAMSKTHGIWLTSVTLRHTMDIWHSSDSRKIHYDSDTARHVICTNEILALMCLTAAEGIKGLIHF